MAVSSLIKKLRIQPNQKILVLNPPDGYLQLLGELPEDVDVHDTPVGEFDFVQIFATDSGELDRLKKVAASSVKYDGLLWVSYPKKSSKIESDLSRDMMWDLFEDDGLRPVIQISIDSTWSALRFRPKQEVGK